MRQIAILIRLVLLGTTFTFALGNLARATISDCIDATCRLSTNSGAIGTGCCVERENGQLFIITAAHVVEGERTVSCEFWRRGHSSSHIQGSVVWRARNADLAIVAVAESALNGILPAVMPLADSEVRLEPGDTVYSVGCAYGKWPTAWKGHFLGYEQGDVIFRPSPAEGRSGSALFDPRSQRVVAIISARSNQRAIGIATSIYPPTSANDRTAAESLTQHCPDGTCDLLEPFGRLRQDDGWRPSPDQPVWPTLPNQSADAGDLRSANQKLEEITVLLKQLIAADRSAPNAPRTTDSLPMQPVVPEGLPAPISGDTSPTGELAQLKESVSSMRNLVESVAGDMETIPERFAERLERVRSAETDSAAEIARAYARDYLAEKTEDGTLGWTIGKTLSGALGLSGPLGLGLAVGMWFLSRRMGRKLEAGDSLLVERLGERLSDKLDRLKDRIDKKQ